MAEFAEILNSLPPVDQLARLELYFEGDATPRAVIENRPGQAGSLRVYHALYERYGAITPEAAAEGLRLFAEHTADAEANPGKHPNIDRLFALRDGGETLRVRLIEKS